MYAGLCAQDAVLSSMTASHKAVNDAAAAVMDTGVRSTSPATDAADQQSGASPMHHRTTSSAQESGASKAPGTTHHDHSIGHAKDLPPPYLY